MCRQTNTVGKSIKSTIQPAIFNCLFTTTTNKSVHTAIEFIIIVNKYLYKSRPPFPIQNCHQNNLRTLILILVSFIISNDNMKPTTFKCFLCVFVEFYVLPPSNYNSQDTCHFHKNLCLPWFNVNLQH